MGIASWRHFVLILLCTAAACAQQTGEIDGLIKSSSEQGVAGLVVSLIKDNELRDTRTTDENGKFIFEGITAGKYVISFKMEEGSPYQMEAEVTPGARVVVEKQIPENIGKLAGVTVYAASRETENLINAPASISSVDSSAKELYAGVGQVPGILAGVPGAQPTQSGLYDFNYNVRGFNALLNRRVGVLIDGRDPSVPFLGNQEWSALAFLSDDLQTMEVLRGSSAALYGQDAFNGVINLTTRSPRESLGGDLRFSAGELQTYNVDGRWAVRLAPTWFMKVEGGYTGSNDFSRSRNVSVEYPGLPMEVIPLPTRHVDLGGGLVRVDKYFRDDRMLSMEFGADTLAGPVFVIGVGRAQSDAIRTWTTAHLTLPHADFLFFDNTRDSPNEPALGSGVPIFERDRNYQGEARIDRRLGTRTSLLAGGEFRYETVTTANDEGVQTLLSHPVDAHRGAVFGQAKRSLGERLSLTATFRIDASTLYATQYSPRIAAVYRLGATQSLFASVGDAFQAPNYAELYLFVPAGRPVNLSPIEAAFGNVLGGVPLGFESVPVFGIGNEHLRVEHVRSAQAGYKQVFHNRTMVTLDFYHNWMRDFITDLVPGVNPDYGPYVAPAALGPPVRALVSQTVNQLVPGITNGPDGQPWIVYSQGNAGHVTSVGVEASVSGWLGNAWQYNGNYSWFYYSLNDAAARAEVHANAPQHSGFASFGYRKPRFMADVRYRWVNAFYFASGIFHGPVPTYNLVDLGATYELSRSWKVGVNVSNLLNNRHYEEFGGDILRRLALAYVTYSWK